MILTFPSSQDGSFDNDGDPSSQDDSFDNDGDPTFTPKQISIMKSTTRDNVKEFQGSSIQKTNLNQTLDDLSGRLPRKE